MDLGEEYSISPSLFMELGISQPSPFAIHNNKNSALCFRDVKCTMNFASFLKPFSSIKTQKNPTTQFRSYSKSPITLSGYTKTGKIWSNQDKLQKFEIPEIKDTCARFSKFVQPILSPKEWEVTKSKISKFEQSQEVKFLQKQLIELSEITPTSWIAGFWDTMYLELRDPVVINISPYLLLTDNFPYVNTNDAQVERASALIFSSLKWNHLLKTEELSPDVEGGLPLDMSQYKYILGSARIPKTGRDVVIPHENSKHILVIRNRQFFSLKVEDSNGKIINREQIQESLREIIRRADAGSPENSIGIFTTEDRDTWAKYRSMISDLSAKNQKNFEIIDSALFGVSLDDANTSNLDEVSRIMLHSNGHNRWFDKIINLIVLKNGITGVLMEHSPIDGHTALRYAYDVHNDSNNTKAIVIPDGLVSEGKQTSQIEHLSFDVNDEVKDGLHVAEKKLNSLVDTTFSAFLKFDIFGKNDIKKVKLSPDAFVQMAYQLAYYREYNKFESTYESGMIKNFKAGRTETIRTVSPQSVAYCEQFDLNNPAQTSKLLREAVSTHVNTSSEARKGHGCDRHLFALKCLAYQTRQRLSGFSIPDLFTDPSYSKYGGNVISTSNCGNDAVQLLGFGPVHSKGIGLGYVIHDNSIQVNITSFENQNVVNRYREQLKQALIDQLTVAKQA